MDSIIEFLSNNNLTRVVRDTDGQERTVQRVVLAVSENNDTIPHLLIAFIILAWAVGCFLFMALYLYRFTLHYNREEDDHDDDNED